MKIVYCIHSVSNPGGMERVMINKINYLVEHCGHEIVIVTTDQHSRPPFYPIHPSVRLFDLDINYSVDNDKPLYRKITGYLTKRRIHRKRLTALLYEEHPDIVVSLYPSESSFIPHIKDGSRKVLELHFNKFFRLQYNRHGLMGLLDRMRTRQDEKLVRKFDKFVVLSEEDRSYWGNVPNMTVISNAALRMSDRLSSVNVKRVLAVGRLDYQKGFDRLIEAWKMLQDKYSATDWCLDIFGQGEWKDMLLEKIQRYRIGKTVHINIPTKNIVDEYINSSMLVMSSHYEGFPMVMIEAMSAGLPVVTFDFKCGPKDIIRNGENGLLVPEGDIAKLADSMYRLMNDDTLRKSMSNAAVDVRLRYSDERIMAQWTALFNDLIKK